MDWWLKPGGSSPFHVHPRQVERVTGVDGELVISFRDKYLGKRELVVSPGYSVSVPAGVVHDFRNVGDEPAHMIVDFIPGLDSKRFFESVAGLALDGKVDAAGRPRNVLLLAVFVWGYREVFMVARPPRWLQRLGLAPLAALGRALGYDAHREHYSRPVVAGDSGAEEKVLAAAPLVPQASAT